MMSFLINFIAYVFIYVYPLQKAVMWGVLQHQWCWPAMSDSMCTPLRPHHQLLQPGQNSCHELIHMSQEKNLTLLHICYCRWRMLVWCVWLAWESWRRLLQELVQGYLTEVFKEVCTLCSMWHTLPIALKWHSGKIGTMHVCVGITCYLSLQLFFYFFYQAVLCWKRSIGVCGCP